LQHELDHAGAQRNVDVACRGMALLRIVAIGDTFEPLHHGRRRVEAWIQIGKAVDALPIRHDLRGDTK